MFQNYQEALVTFEVYAEIEPRLRALHELCSHAGPPHQAPADDPYQDDPFELDEIERPQADGWCAERFFFLNVKSRLQLLVGGYRVREPQELRTSEAYENVYEFLLTWVLDCRCTSCAPTDLPDEDEQPRSW